MSVWLDLVLYMGQYAKECEENVKSGKVRIFLLNIVIKYQILESRAFKLKLLFYQRIRNNKDTKYFIAVLPFLPIFFTNVLFKNSAFLDNF